MQVRRGAGVQGCRCVGVQVCMVAGVQVRRGADLHVLLREHEGLGGALIRLHGVSQPLERRDPKAVAVQQQRARRVRAAQQRQGRLDQPVARLGVVRHGPGGGETRAWGW